MPRGLAIVFRLAAHLAAWIPFAIGAVRSVQHGSAVIADGAVIALRSWDVLTPYGPLVGQATQLRNGAFDPGPLEYWLLAIPVHIDPRTGVVWGAALWCMLAASLAVEAARSAFGAFGGLAASGIIVGTVAWQPLVAAQPYWNPWFGVIFFLATLAAGLAVVSGRRHWWPVLVVTASVAAQTHLMFALASAALVLVAFAAGLADTIRARAGYWWAVLGLMAGAACWIAPVIQQFTSRRGNLSLLIGSLGARQSAGPAFALKALTASVLPPTVWWQPSLAFRSEGIASQISGRTPAFAVVMLALTVVVLAVAVRPLRSRPLAALAAVSLLASGAVLATYWGIPVNNLGRRDQNYLLIVLLPVGLLAWLTLGAAAVLAARRVTGRARVLTADSRGREVILAVLQSGDYVGEMSLIDNEPHSATVRAEVQTDMLILGRTEFARCLPENSSLSYAIMRGLVQRLRSADRQIESLALLDVYGRVARTLLDMSEMEGEVKIIRNKVSRQDLAKVVGASREMVSRVMKDLEGRGMVQTQENGWVVIKEQLTA